MQKSIKYLFFLLLVLITACDKTDDAITDTISEFIFFTETNYAMNELTNSTEGNELEIHVEMLALKRTEDIVVTLDISGENAVEGVDYEIVSPSSTITIPAGETTSEEGFKIRTVNNLLSSPDPRFVQITISTVSDVDLNIGRGLSNPTNNVVRIEIVDDECPDDIGLFNNAEWTFTGSNTVYYSDYGGTFETQVNGDKMTIIGDIANYDVGITILATLVPNPIAPTTGTILFDEDSTIGSDGTYDYRWVLNEVGTYDICARTMQLSTTLQYIDIYGPDPTAWVDWYVSNIDAVISVPGSSGPVPPTGSVGGNIAAQPDEVIAITGSFSDVQGLSEITIQNADLGIDQTIMLSGEAMYELNEEFTIPTMTMEGDYPVQINVTNIEGLSVEFSINVSISIGACMDDFTVFDGVSLTANADIPATDGSFDPYMFTNTVEASLDGDKLTLSGDFIDFFDTQLTVTMVPDDMDATVGTVTFSEEDIGMHTDGYTYRLVSPQDGVYDACAGTFTVYYDMEYSDGADGWIFYYSVVTEFSL
jgi:hypothetical protein